MTTSDGSAFDLWYRPDLTPSRSCRLKAGELRLRGFGTPDQPSRRIKVGQEQLDRFAAVLGALEASDWRPDYHSEDCGYLVLDNTVTWGFTAVIGNLRCSAGGTDAYPSTEDARKSSMEWARFGILIEEMSRIFGVELDLRSW